MKKQIIMSLAVITAVSAAAIGGTMALFSDTETSNGNIFTAGAIDLKVDHTYASYNGEECNDCVVPQNAVELIVNGGFETPEPTDNGGAWQVYPDGSQTNWDVVSGSGLEIQENGAVPGALAHGGDQLAELDSHIPGLPASAVKQVINTTPGQKYRLTFYHSPRPGNEPNTDNGIALSVLVTSNSGVLVNQTVGNPSSGATTNWTPYTFDFTALDTQTTVKFTDAGSQEDTLGGYLDDVSVRMLDCPTDTYTLTKGGTCKLWSEKDLQASDVFWNFTDVKPADWGKNTISLHVYSNDAFVCLMPKNVLDDENTVLKPETLAGDTAAVGIPNGELSMELEFFMWQDNDADNTYDAGEPILVPAGTPFKNIASMQLALASPAPVTLVGVQWCAGDQALAGVNVTCDGNGMGNIAQTDKVTSDFVAYAVQQRNNSGFTCSQLP
ncbi:MAG: DUF642 domain-containing protein [Candidatus Moranbacteria bacterium]|nr:DUF642 domain-containing protein [Candidatus Moranbacteria bacterium]